MRVLGLIPARGGSVRLPGKNMEMIRGISLVERAIRTAGHCRRLARIAVTTDRQAIKDIATRCRASIVDRPPELSRGDQPMQLTVVLHALSFLSPDRFDAVALLQPTSPLRTHVDIDSCIELLEESRADSVVSVVDGGDDVAYQVRHARRLEKIPNVVVPNGAVYLMRTEGLLRGDNWFSGHVYAYPMPKDRSIDIDTQLDLASARLAVENAEGF